MKKLLITIVICMGSLFTITHSADINDVVDWAYNKGLTIFNEPNSFMAYNSIRRDEASKFYTNFAKLLGKNIGIVDQNQCNFSDLNLAWDDLRGNIREACVYGLFKGNNGKFNPTGNITNAEAITVLIRLIDGYQSENSTHRADNYYKRAEELGLVVGSPNTIQYRKDEPATRGYIITMIYEASEILDNYDDNYRENYSYQDEDYNYEDENYRDYNYQDYSYQEEEEDSYRDYSYRNDYEGDLDEYEGYRDLDEYEGYRDLDEYEGYRDEEITV